MTQYINSALTIMKKCENYELKRIDAEIAELEARISLKQEQRREIINRKDLNKCSHKNQVIFPGLCISDVMVKSGYLFCTDCGNKDFGNNEIKNSSNNSPIASEWSAR